MRVLQECGPRRSRLGQADLEFPPMMPESNDTLLRVVRRRVVEQNDELSVIGIDDFAFRRGQTYETIVCDLQGRPAVTYCRPVTRGCWAAESSPPPRRRSGSSAPLIAT